MVARARRVIGYGGAFPPYERLRKKFVDARDFNDAFGLYEYKEDRQDDRRILAFLGRPLREMGDDHQFPVAARR